VLILVFFCGGGGDEQWESTGAKERRLLFAHRHRRIGRTPRPSPIIHIFPLPFPPSYTHTHRITPLSPPQTHTPPPLLSLSLTCPSTARETQGALVVEAKRQRTPSPARLGGGPGHAPVFVCVGVERCVCVRGGGVVCFLCVCVCVEGAT
jgi:hypothetical protein